MKIKKTMSFCVAATSVVMVLLSAHFVRMSYEKVEGAEKARQLVTISSGLIDIATDLLVERSGTNAYLSSDGSKEAEMLKSRKGTDQDLQKLEGSLGVADHQTASTVADRLARMKAAIKSARADADTIAAQSGPRKATPATDAIYWEFTRIGDSSVGVANDLTNILSVLDVRAANMAKLAILAFVVRDFEGRCTVSYTKALSAKIPFSIKMAEEMAYNAGQGDRAYAEIEAIRTDGDVSQAVKDEIVSVTKEFYLPFHAIRDEMDQLATVGSYPMDATQWRAKTQPMLKAVMRIKDAAIAGEEENAVTQRRDAIRTMLFFLVVGLVSLSIQAISAIVIARRVTRPLLKMTDIIRDIAAGERAITVPFIMQNDEIGTLAQGVSVLLANSVKAEQLALEREKEGQVRDSQRAQMDVLTQEFVQSIDFVVHELTGTAETVRDEANQVFAAASVAETQSAAVKTASDSSSQKVQMVAAATEQLAVSIQEINRDLLRIVRPRHLCRNQRFLLLLLEPTVSDYPRTGPLAATDGHQLG